MCVTWAVLFALLLPLGSRASVATPAAALRAAKMARGKARKGPGAAPFLKPSTDRSGAPGGPSASSTLRAEEMSTAGGAEADEESDDAMHPVDVGSLYMQKTEHADWEKQLHFCKLPASR